MARRRSSSHSAMRAPRPHATGRRQRPSRWLRGGRRPRRTTWADIPRARRHRRGAPPPSRPRRCDDGGACATAIVSRVRCGDGARSTTFHDALVRSGPGHATEFHLDADEAHAAGVGSGAVAHVIAVTAQVRASRRLVTERDVVNLAAQGQSIPAGRAPHAERARPRAGARTRPAVTHDAGHRSSSASATPKRTRWGWCTTPSISSGVRSGARNTSAPSACRTPRWNAAEPCSPSPRPPLRFHASARYDDLVRVDTTLSDVRSRAITFEYEISRAGSGTRLVTASTRLISLDRQGRPVPLPEDVRALLAAGQGGDR